MQQVDMHDTTFDANQLGGLVANDFGTGLVPESALMLSAQGPGSRADQRCMLPGARCCSTVR